MSNQRKPRVAVIGLNKGSQLHMLEKEFGDKLDLRFFTSSCNSSRFQEVTKVSDVIVLMTKFIPHKVQEAVKEGLSPDTKFMMVHGGLSRLKREIRQFCG
jgi:hypothetical protein